MTDHQSYTLSAFERISNFELDICVVAETNRIRDSQGWKNRHFGLSSHTVLPRKKWISFIFRRVNASQSAIHIFGSPFENTKFMLALFLAVIYRKEIYIISESYCDKPMGYLDNGSRFLNWIKFKLRPYLYLIYGFFLKKNISGVFAISKRAFIQYSAMGIAATKIYPFGYFVPKHFGKTKCNQKRKSCAKVLKICFVGTLIERKGLALILNAVKRLNSLGNDVSLDVYGPGDPQKFNFDNPNIFYCGTIKFGEAQSTIADYDFLVLPSFYDGWGVVVNESLMSGVPVICSTGVGSASIVEKWGCGAVFENGSEDDLFFKLKEIIQNPALYKSMKDSAEQLDKALSPDNAAAYMNQRILGITNWSPNNSPWYNF